MHFISQIIVTADTHLHSSIKIVILSPYSLSPFWWQWRRWLWRPSPLLKRHEQESQGSVGGGHSWACWACHRSSCWTLDSNVLVLPCIVLLQEGPFAATVSQVSGSVLACIRDVFNWSLRCCFGPSRSLLLLASSLNRFYMGVEWDTFWTHDLPSGDDVEGQ